jgi:hypothetical protein
MTDKVIHGKFANNAISACFDEIYDVLYSYHGRVTVAEIIGVLELLKMQLWVELE